MALSVLNMDGTQAYLQQLARGDLSEVVTEKTFLRVDDTTFEGRLTAGPLRHTGGTIEVLDSATPGATFRIVLPFVG